MSEHPTTTTWLAYLDGELNPAEQDVVEQHLIDCPACRADLDSRRGIRQCLGQLATSASIDVDHAWLAVRPRLKRPWTAWLRPVHRLAYGMGSLVLLVLFVWATATLIKQRADLKDSESASGGSVPIGTSTTPLTSTLPLNNDPAPTPTLFEGRPTPTPWISPTPPPTLPPTPTPWTSSTPIPPPGDGPTPTPWTSPTPPPTPTPGDGPTPTPWVSPTPIPTPTPGNWPTPTPIPPPDDGPTPTSQP